MDTNLDCMKRTVKENWGPPIRTDTLSLFCFGMFESMYEGASVLLLACFIDVTELVVDDGKKMKHARLSVLTLWSIAGLALVVVHHDTLHEMKRLKHASRRPLSYMNAHNTLCLAYHAKIGLKSCRLNRALVSALTERVHLFWRRRGFAEWLCREGDLANLLLLAFPKSPPLPLIWEIPAATVIF